MRKQISSIGVLVALLLMVASVSFAVETKNAAGGKSVNNAAVTAPASDTVAKGAVIDINSASETELKSIPGIGDAYASKIVAGRPYANKAQLKSRNILPGTVYEQVKERIIARQPKKDAKPADKKK